MKPQRQIVYKEESYELMRILFDIHNELGPSYDEKHYHRAIELKLKARGKKYLHEYEIEYLMKMAA